MTKELEGKEEGVFCKNKECEAYSTDYCGDCMLNSLVEIFDCQMFIGERASHDRKQG